MEGRSLLLLTGWMVFATVFPSDAQMNITQAGCGVTKLCVETPNACNPAGNGTCLFMSVANSTQPASSMTSLSFELSGQSLGYIALGLVNGSEASSMAFICGQKNGTFFSSTMQVNNTDYTLTPLNETATGTQVSVNGNLIQCQFKVLVQSTNFSIVLGTGTFGTNGPQTFTPSLTTAAVDLTIPASNVSTTAASTSMVGNNTTTTTNGSSGGSQTVNPSPNANQTSANTTTASTSMAGNTTTMTNGSSGGSQTVTPSPNANQTSTNTTAASTPMAGNTTTMTMAMTTTTTTGASGALHAHAFLLLLSIITWSILQKA